MPQIFAAHLLLYGFKADHQAALFSVEAAKAGCRLQKHLAFGEMRKKQFPQLGGGFFRGSCAAGQIAGNGHGENPLRGSEGLVNIRAGGAGFSFGNLDLIYHLPDIQSVIVYVLGLGSDNFQRYAGVVHPGQSEDIGSGIGNNLEAYRILL